MIVAQQTDGLGEPMSATIAIASSVVPAIGKVLGGIFGKKGPSEAEIARAQAQAEAAKNTRRLIIGASIATAVVASAIVVFKISKSRSRQTPSSAH